MRLNSCNSPFVRSSADSDGDHNKKMEPTGRFELPTDGLRNRCSTPELRRLGIANDPKRPLGVRFDSQTDSQSCRGGAGRSYRPSRTERNCRFHPSPRPVDFDHHQERLACSPARQPRSSTPTVPARNRRGCGQEAKACPKQRFESPDKRPGRLCAPTGVATSRPSRAGQA